MNNDIIRIRCPRSGIGKQERINRLYADLSKWVYSDALKTLLELYEVNINRNLDFKEYVRELHKTASKLWDFRQKKAEQGNRKEMIERWLLEDEQFVLDNQEVILESARKLGLVDITEPLFVPDYICPLGGARLANLYRCLAAQMVVDENNWENKKIVALSGTRPVSEIERPYLEQYAADADTEYDAICRGLERAFDLNEYQEKKIVSENVNSCAAIREYSKKYHGSVIYSVAAPSSAPDVRRANSADTFEYFLKQFEVNTGEKILLTTNCIYQPFQLLRFIMLGLEHDFEVDCIGVGAKIDGTAFSKPSNYLQEIKATIDAISNFCDKY